MTLTPDRTEELENTAPNPTQWIESMQGEVVSIEEPNLLSDPFSLAVEGTLVFRQEESALPSAETLIAELEAAHRRALLMLQARQIEEVLGMSSVTHTEPHYVRAQRVIDEQRERYAQQDRERERYLGYHSPYGDRDWYCYCSPRRGDYFDRHRMAREEMRRAMREEMMSQPVMPWEPAPVAMTPDELAHTCSPDGNGVCVWANCPNNTTHLSGTAMDINTSRGDEAMWELMDEANLGLDITTWVRGDDEPEPSRELTSKVEVSKELVLARKAVRVAQEETQRMELALAEVIPVPEPAPRPSLARRVLAGVCALIL